MRVLIVEDEKVSATQMKVFIRQYEPSIEILHTINSCKDLRKWLEQKERVDLIFCDIELTDGNVLETLRNAELHSAIIFTTAYDNYWSEALKMNGIDYLLKPITMENVHAALDKAEAIKRVFANDQQILSRIEKLVGQQNFQYKNRFPVRLNNEVFVVEAERIQLFRIVQGVILAFTDKGKKLPLLEETLNELENKLNPDIFFRINRSEIINIRYLDSIKIQEGNEYIVNLKGLTEKLQVSNSKTGMLKDWLNGSKGANAV